MQDVRLRHKTNLTQRQLADALDVTVTTISSWENLRHEPKLTFSQIKLLMRVLNCSFEDLAKEMEDIPIN